MRRKVATVLWIGWITSVVISNVLLTVAVVMSSNHMEGVFLLTLSAVIYAWLVSV